MNLVSFTFFLKTFLGKLVGVMLIPTTGLIFAVIIFGIQGMMKKDYSKLKRYNKWWLYSLVPLIIIYAAWIGAQYWHLKVIGVY